MKEKVIVVVVVYDAFGTIQKKVSKYLMILLTTQIIDFVFVELFFFRLQ